MNKDLWAKVESALLTIAGAMIIVGSAVYLLTKS